MGNNYDRVDNEGNGYGSGSFMMGLLAGTVLGAGLGMLFAPKAGSDLRRQLGEQADSLANNASQTYRRASQAAGDWAGKAQESASDWADKAAETASDLADRGKELYGRAREAAARGAEEAERTVREAADAGAASRPRI
jgi:gas vesicle protein